MKEHRARKPGPASLLPIEPKAGSLSEVYGHVLLRNHLVPSHIFQVCSGGPERRDLLKVVLRGDTLNLRFYLKKKFPSQACTWLDTDSGRGIDDGELCGKRMGDGGLSLPSCCAPEGPASCQAPSPTLHPLLEPVVGMGVSLPPQGSSSRLCSPEAAWPAGPGTARDVVQGATQLFSHNLSQSEVGFCAS